MNWFAIVSLSAAIACIALGIIVYFFNRKAVLNKIFLHANIVGFVYGFTTVMMWLSDNPDTANFWHKMGTLWPLYAVLVLTFALVFTNQEWIKHKLNWLLLGVPAIVFWMTDLFTFEINSPPVLKYWGYNDVASGTLIYYISTVWVAVLSLLAFILCFRYYRKTTDVTKRAQTKYVAGGLGIPVITFIATNMATRSFGIDFPNLGIISTFSFSIFVGYAIVKYELFTLDRCLTSDNIITAIPDMLVLANAGTQILRVNDQFLEFVGYSEKELKAVTISQLLAEGEEENWENIQLKLWQNIAIRNYELKLRTKSGDVKHVLFSGSKIFSKKGKIVGLVCIMKDLTRRLELEERLLKAERLASIGELAGQVGHDLRNPLTAIQNAAYLMKNKATKSEDKLAMICCCVENAIADSNRIINSLVEYSSNLHPYIKNCTPKQVLRNALLTVKVPDRIKIIDLTTDEAELPVDDKLMKIVFAKLIQNAIDAIPCEGQIEIASTVKGEYIELSVTDSGTGVSETVLPKLFSPLVTTKAKGMGMSLAICKRIIEAHKGDISVETEKGKGTTFTIRIPLICNMLVAYPESVLLEDNVEAYCSPKRENKTK